MASEITGGIACVRGIKSGSCYACKARLPTPIAPGGGALSLNQDPGNSLNNRENAGVHLVDILYPVFLADRVLDHYSRA
ncbi:hypothetical protein FVEN_g2695 [Fusarium venenatum]|nr:hypothetical protein FVEN_g2695 [Fusarium venenatum]